MRADPILVLYLISLRRKSILTNWPLDNRHAKSQANDTISNDLHDALLDKDNVQFWKIWNSRFNNGRESQPVMVDGSVDPVELFAKHFCNVCQPNSAQKTLVCVRSLIVRF